MLKRRKNSPKLDKNTHYWVQIGHLQPKNTHYWYILVTYTRIMRVVHITISISDLFSDIMGAILAIEL